MSYEVSQAEMEAVMSLAGPDRYSYFVAKAGDWEELWSLGNEGIEILSQ